ncbi:hypothetical protein D3C84_943750 [compost metagenome]
MPITQAKASHICRRCELSAWTAISPTALFISFSSSSEALSRTARSLSGRSSCGRKSAQSRPTRRICSATAGTWIALMLRAGFPLSRSRWAWSNWAMVASRVERAMAPWRSSSASLVIFWLSMRWAPATLMVSGDTDMLR